MQSQERKFNCKIFGSTLVPQENKASHTESQPFQRHEGHKVECLISYEKSHNPGLVKRGLFSIGEDGDINVWILIKIIGGAMVLVMSSYPPGPTQTN